MKKLLLLLSLLIASAHTVFGQAEGSVVSATARAGVATTFVTDYHSIGINPANLGLRSKYETKHITFGLLEMNASAFAKGVTKRQMNDYIFSGDSLSPSGQANAVRLFSNNNISANIDLMLLGIAFQSDKLGGLAFSVNDVARGNGNLSQNFTDFAFAGGASTRFFDKLRLENGTIADNDPSKYSYYQTPAGGNGIDSALSTNGVSLGQVFRGTTIKAHYYRTFNVAYGREVFRNEVFNVSVGVGLKYVLGYYYMNVQSENGVLHGKVADNPTFSGVSSAFNVPSQSSGWNLINPQGQGAGFDLGTTVEIYDKIKIGVSIVNVGSIKYTKNTYDVVDDTVTAMKYRGATGDALNRTINWKEASGSFTVKLPTTIRLGGSIALLEKRLEVGGDIIVPLNKEAGNINKAIYALGGDFYLKRWIKLSSGVSMGGNYANSINGYSTHVCVPFGFTLIAGENAGWEFGMSTRDIISLIDINGKSPLYSAGICMFRFRV